MYQLTVEERAKDYAKSWILCAESFGDHETVGKLVWVLAKASDPDAHYSYQDYALVFCPELKTFYLLETCGCSCPSPNETGVELDSTSTCTSWRELQVFLARNVPWLFFTQLVEDLDKVKDQIDKVCFDGSRGGYRY